MNMEIILNELSICTLAEDVRIAQERMLHLIQTIKTCVEYGLERVVRAKSDVHMFDLAVGYNIAKWRNDGSVDIEARRYFRSITVKAPLIDSESAAEVQKSAAIAEFRFDGNEAQGLGLAFLLGSLAVSIQSETRWDASMLGLQVYELNDENGEILERAIDVRHASGPDHVRTHENWILERKQSALTDGSDLWARRVELFPHLIFCPQVERQLRSLHAQESIFHSVVAALFDLESYFRLWTTGPFRRDRLGRLASPESERTLAQYRIMRTFLCPDGISRLFSWHLKLTPSAWRLYFLPKDDDRNCLIGYIGPHLLTARYD